MTPALFFDLDGTLVDTERRHWEAWRDTLGPLGIAFSWLQYEAQAIGHSDPDILSSVASRAPDRFAQIDTLKILEAKRKQFCTIVSTVSLFHPDIVDVLRLIAHWDIALVTSSTRMETFAVLAGAGLSTLFKTIICLEDVQRPKPDPQPYLVAMHRLSVRDGFAFEDSSVGSISARAAGLAVIEVRAPSEVCAVIRSEFLPRY